MEKTTHIKALTTITIGLAVIVVGAILLGSLREADKKKVSATPATSPEATAFTTASPSATPDVEPVASPSVGASLTPSPRVSATPRVLPASVNTFLSNFYAAYSAKNSDRIADSFTPDISQENRERHSTLFKGVDLTGVPGGPTITDADRANAYTVLNFEETQTGWNVSIQEQRVASDGTSLAPVAVVLQLLPSSNPPGSWLIDSYTRTGEVGKYSGFDKF